MVVSTTDDFLTLVEMSRLIPAARVAKLRSEIPVHLLHNAERIASELTRRRLLTNWQAQQILAGHTRFFYGKYKLLDQIGIGGMGVVYKAEMTAMGRIVALKMMSHDLVNNTEAVARFEREVKAAAKLNHPNVVCAYDAICEDDVYFLVLEYVHGGNVNQWLKREGPLPSDWACECIRQAALGLQHAHEHGIVHRDIKPGNILVSADNTHSLPLVKILDMGLARLTNHLDAPPTEGMLTRQGQVLGTPDYIAPEQARDTRTADIRCDVFSLGVTFFKMLTGRLPYGGNTAMEKIMARTNGPAPRVISVRRDVSPALDAVVAKMLEIDPEHRYQEPWEVAQAVAPFSIINRISRLRGDQASPSSILAGAMSEMLTARGKQEAEELLDPENALGDDFVPPGGSSSSASVLRGASAIEKTQDIKARPGSGVVKKPPIPAHGSGVVRKPGIPGSSIVAKPPIPGPDGTLPGAPTNNSTERQQIRMLVAALALVACAAILMVVARIMGW